MKKSHEETAKDLLNRNVIPNQEVSMWTIAHCLLAINDTLRELLKEARKK